MKDETIIKAANILSDGLVAAAKTLGDALDRFGMEYLANERVGSFLSAASGVEGALEAHTEALRSLESTLENCLNNIDADLENIEEGLK